jgi:hypothetical protein
MKHLPEISSIQSVGSLSSGDPIDVQVTTARRFPRDVAAARKRAVEMATIDLDTAASCIWQRPVGKDKSGKEIVAEGPSIRAAEIIASSWGNLRCASKIDEIGDTYVVASAMAWDLESNNAIRTECREFCIYRDGKPFDERLKLVVAKAAAKKALRDAIFAVVPQSIKHAVMTACQQAIGQAGAGKADPKRIAKAKAWLAQIGVSEQRALRTLGINSWDEATEAHIGRLAAIAQAIADEETTPDIAFPHMDEGARGPEPGRQAPSSTEAQAEPPPANMKEAKVKLIRLHLKKLKVSEADWIAAAFRLGILPAEMPLEQAVAAYWDALSARAIDIERELKQRAGGGQ